MRRATTSTRREYLKDADKHSPRARGKASNLEPSPSSLVISSTNTSRARSPGSFTPEDHATIDLSSEKVNVARSFKDESRARNTSLSRSTRMGPPSGVTRGRGRHSGTVQGRDFVGLGSGKAISSSSGSTRHSERSRGGSGNAYSKAITTPPVHTVSKRVKKKQGGANLPILTNRNLAVNPSSHYTIKPVIPAQNAELLSVARAMNREEFAPRLKKLFDPEREAALEAIESGHYVGWRCPEYKHDCIRVGSKSKCFCGHPLLSHGGKSKQFNHVCEVGDCNCKSFAFIPSRPEEIGEWWLPKRPGFDVEKWRAKCRCKHTHEEHNPSGRRQCSVKGCTCFAFDSNFLCCACDRHWEDHQTFFDTIDQRKTGGLPYGEEYLPFHEMPDLRNIVLTGNDNDSSQYDAITSGPYAIPRFEPTPLSKQLNHRLQR